MAPDPPPAPAFSFTFSPLLSSFNVPVEVYLSLHDEYDAIASGALIFDSRDRLLLLQRAADDSMPRRWETPGGGCDLDDETILHGVVREVWEESGLKVIALRQRVGPEGGDVFITTRRGLRVCKFTFEADVESTEVVRLDPNEHQNYMWVTEEECKSDKVGHDGSIVEIKFTTSAQKATILEGFRLRNAAKLDSL